MLSGSRTRLDSIIYWSVFFFIAVFITYFLNSMISLANTDDMTVSSDAANGYRSQSARIQEQRASRFDEIEKEASGENDIISVASE